MTEKAQKIGARTWWRKTLDRSLVFGLVGFLDILLTAEIGAAGSEAFHATPLIVSLWVLLGFVLTALEQGLWTLLFGRGGEDRVMHYCKSRWNLYKKDAERPIDRQRVALFGATALTLALLIALSALWLAYLITYRHGTALIVAAFVIGQVILLALSAVIGASLYARLSVRLSRLRPNGIASKLFSLPTLLRILTAGSTVVLLALVVWQLELMIAIDAFAFLLVGFALFLRPLAVTLFPDGRKRRIDMLVWPLFVLFAMVLGSQSERARLTTTSQTMTAKYVYGLLQKLSDIDGDQSPNFPYYADCSPLNPDIHPRAVEIPKNGIDEDCDGLDELVGDYSPVRRRAKLKPKVKRDLVLLTMDATRADHTGFMGYERDTTPHLDKFAKSASVFTRAYSQDSGTGPSLWSLMVGKTPFQVKLEDADRFPPQIAASETTLAERLQKAGYDTVAIVCGDVFGVKKKKKTWNIRRGFRTFREVCGKRPNKQAAIVTKKAMAQLRRLRRSKKPFFLWVHYLDPHHPYFQHPENLFGPRKIDGYDEEIRYTDREMSPLLKSLTKGKRQPWVALTADHGENFGDHGTSPHARTLYTEVTHVPLLIRAPKGEGRQIEAAVASGDINPTFLELASISVPDELTMVSQAAVVLGEEIDEDRLVFQENSYSRPRRDAKAVVGPRYHLIWDSTNDIYEFYDLLNDPREQTNIAGRGIPREAELRKILKRFAQSTNVPKKLAK